MKSGTCPPPPPPVLSSYRLYLSVCLKPINVKTAEPIGQKFYVGPHMAQGKIYGCSDLFKILSPKPFDFCKF